MLPAGGLIVGTAGSVGGATPHSPATPLSPRNGNTTAAKLTAGQRKNKRKKEQAAAGNKKKKGGFVDIPQGEHRRVHGRRAISQGNERTCGQDAALAIGRDLELRFTKEEIYHATLPPAGNTEIGLITTFVGSSGASVEPIMDELAHVSGGLAYALLQLAKHRYLVELNVTHHDGQVDRHTVAYLAEQPWGWAGENGVGTIIDNGVGPVKGITARDRSSWALAREVFDNLFPEHTSVRVDGVWRVRRR